MAARSLLRNCLSNSHEKKTKYSLVMNGKQGFFHRHGNGPWPNVVQQDGTGQFFVAQVDPLGRQGVQRLLHQVQGSKRVVEAGMDGTWIYQFGETQLPDMPHALQIPVLQEIENDFTLDPDKSIQRIVNDGVLGCQKELA